MAKEGAADGEDDKDEEEEQFYDCPDDEESMLFACLDRIFAVCLPASPPGDGAVGGVGGGGLLLFRSSAEALAKLKEHRGARFKVFNSYPEAKRFASSTVEQLTPKTAQRTTAASAAAEVRQETDSFKGVGQVQLNQLKAAINAGDLATVSALIWNNPKYLVTDCDTPTLLMPRFRYNCLHQAALRNQPAVIKLLLTVLSRDEIWARLNSETGPDLRRSRRARLLDLYLNSREMALGETPLHLAAKFCHADCVRHLVARRECDLGVVNNAGKTALEVLGSRLEGSAARQALMAETRLALCGQFVALVSQQQTASGGGGRPAHVLAPMPAWRLQSLLEEAEGDLRVRAYAGPAEPELARALYERWRAPSRLLFCSSSWGVAEADEGDPQLSLSPPRFSASPVPGRPAGFEFQSPTTTTASSSVCSRRTTPAIGTASSTVEAAAAELALAPLLDYDKGYEITGRALCRAMGGAGGGIAWRERWDFFGGDFADLATEEGLGRLDRLLSEAYARLDGDAAAAAMTTTTAAAGSCDPWTNYRDGCDAVDGGCCEDDEDDEDSSRQRSNSDNNNESGGGSSSYRCHGNN